MSEDLQAVLDENQGDEVVENQGIEAQQTEANDSQVDSATTGMETEAPETNNVEKRIHKLTAEKYAEKRRAEALEEENRRLKENQSADPVQVPQGKPTLEQFDYDEGKYTEALIEYQVNQKVEQTQSAAQKAQAEQTAKDRDAKFDNAEVKYATDNPSYIDDIQSLPRFQPDTLNMLRGQENGPELVHYLGKNPEIADQIASLDPMNAAMQIGVISANLSATAKTEIQTSAAPEPISTISSGGTVSKEVEDMSMEEIYNLQAGTQESKKWLMILKTRPQ